MIDVKKLITGFLILAAIAGSLALAMPSIGGVMYGNPQAVLATSSSLGGSNAFAPTQTLTTNSADIPEVNADAMNADPNNLTNNFAGALIDNIAQANPDGASTDANGNNIINSPDPNAVLSEFTSDPALGNINIPNWDIEAAEQPLHILNTSSTDVITQYAMGLSNAFKKDFVDTGIQDLANQTSTDSPDLSSIAPGISSALSDVASLQVPSQLASFQKALVKVLVYEKNTLALAQNPGDDAVKSALILQSEQPKYQAATADLATQLQNAKSLGVFSVLYPAPEKENNALTLVNKFLGIPTAHALFGVGDIVFDPLTETETTLTVAQLIWQFAQDILLQVLKNSLVIAVQNNILKYVQNGNQPRFVQQLGGLMLNVFNTAGIKELNNAIPSVYPAYQGITRLTLNQFYQPFTPTALVTSLEFAVGNQLGQFVGNFTRGGNSWAAYGATLLPSGNYYGSLFTASQIAGQAAIARQYAAQTQVIASNGFWPVQKCSDNSDPNPKDGNLCDNGQEPVTLTPGQTINQLVGSATGSDVHLIVNANNIVALAATVLTTLLSKLTGGFTLAGAATAAAPPPAPPLPSLPLACTPQNQSVPVTLASVGNQVTATFGASGGTATTNSAFPTYTWTTAVPAGVTANPLTSTGFTFNPAYTITLPGTYNISATVTASTGGTASCQLQIIAS